MTHIYTIRQEFQCFAQMFHVNLFIFARCFIIDLNWIHRRLSKNHDSIKSNKSLGKSKTTIKNTPEPMAMAANVE